MTDHPVETETLPASNEIKVDKSWMQGITDSVSKISNFLFKKEKEPMADSVKKELPIENESSDERDKKLSQMIATGIEEVANKRDEKYKKEADKQKAIEYERKVIEDYSTNLNKIKEKDPEIADVAKSFADIGKDVLFLVPYLNNSKHFEKTLRYLADDDNLFEVKAMINSLQVGDYAIVDRNFNKLEKRFSEAENADEKSLKNPISTNKTKTISGDIDLYELGRRSNFIRARN